MRNWQGTITTLDVFPQSINDWGQITGTSGVHGFLRTPQGTIIMFDAPGAIGTWPQSINDSGEITGYYRDANGIHDVLRTPQGTINTFDVPDSQQTYAYSINILGEITGTYFDANGITHGFLREP